MIFKTFMASVGEDEQDVGAANDANDDCNMWIAAHNLKVKHISTALFEIIVDDERYFTYALTIGYVEQEQTDADA